MGEEILDLWQQLNIGKDEQVHRCWCGASSLRIAVLVESFCCRCLFLLHVKVSFYLSFYLVLAFFLFRSFSVRGMTCVHTLVKVIGKESVR